jgi:hypothetical protein
MSKVYGTFGVYRISEDGVGVIREFGHTVK